MLLQGAAIGGHAFFPGHIAMLYFGFLDGSNLHWRTVPELQLLDSLRRKDYPILTFDDLDAHNH